MGYWKGSGFAILLDIISSLLSGGLSTSGVDKTGKGSCGRCCQVFIAIDPKMINTEEFINKTIGDTVMQVKSGRPAESGSEIYYPGEQSLRSRHENLAQGIPVDENIWEAVQKLAM